MPRAFAGEGVRAVAEVMATGGWTGTVPSGFRPPVTLTGRFVELDPLLPGHVPELARAGRDPEVWRLLRIGPARNEAEMRALVEGMLADQASGSVLAFVVRRLPERVVCGMFRFFDIDRANRWVEVGTWLDPVVWRTPVNTEVKYLGLRYAFEQERMHRVQLKTDARNVRSQRAIARLGAVREGELREHVRLYDGTFRTSFVYGILEPEWPSVKGILERQLARPWDPPGRGVAELAPPP